MLEDEQSTYEALSYTWGKATPIYPNTLNGDSLRVATNLYTALRHVRLQDTSRVLWIDAICINQHDIKEKNHQVKQMSKIFKSAKRVISWLGKESDRTEKTFAKLEEFAADGAPNSVLRLDRIISDQLAFWAGFDQCQDTWKALVDVASRSY